MENDPGEMNNLVYGKSFTEVLRLHRGLIWKWAEDTRDVEFPYYMN